MAGEQAGIVTRRQLMTAGLSRRAIDRRIAAGRLHPLWRGVYRVGPIEAAHARERAAVLACGPGAVLSHVTAGLLLEYLPQQDAALLHVTVPRARRPRPRGIAVHRGPPLTGGDVLRRYDLPVTAPLRTLLDLAAVLATPELERAAAAAERKGEITFAELPQAARAAPTHRGAACVLRLFDAVSEPAFTRSEAERWMLDLTRRAALPPPRTNRRLLDYEVDFLWTRERLVVEVDGYAYHGSQHAFAQDRRRDAALTAAGYLVLRLTWDDLSNRPEATAVVIARALVRADRAAGP